MAGYIGSRASVVSSGAERKKTFAITGTTTVLTGLSYTPTFVHLFHNGVRLVDGTDYTATNGTSITLTSAAESGDEVVVISYATFQAADAYTKAEADSAFVSDPNGAVTVDGSGNVGIGISPLTALHVAGGGRFTSGTENLNTYHNGTVGYIETNGNASTPIGFANGGLERMRIDADGRVTMPYQPAFCAYKSVVSNTTYGAGNIVSADMVDTKYNVGGHYNTSNGRFTAPISGLYLFWCSLFNNSAALTRIRCDINGGAGAWGQGQSAPSSDWAVTGVAKLNAGDYANLTSAYGGTIVFHDINHSSWGGYLIG